MEGYVPHPTPTHGSHFSPTLPSRSRGTAAATHRSHPPRRRTWPPLPSPPPRPREEKARREKREGDPPRPVVRSCGAPRPVGVELLCSGRLGVWGRQPALSRDAAVPLLGLPQLPASDHGAGHSHAPARQPWKVRGLGPSASFPWKAWGLMRFGRSPASLPDARRQLQHLQDGLLLLHGGVAAAPTLAPAGAMEGFDWAAHLPDARTCRFFPSWDPALSLFRRHGWTHATGVRF